MQTRADRTALELGAGLWGPQGAQYRAFSGCEINLHHHKTTHAYDAHAVLDSSVVPCCG